MASRLWRETLLLAVCMVGLVIVASAQLLSVSQSTTRSPRRIHLLPFPAFQAMLQTACSKRPFPRHALLKRALSSILNVLFPTIVHELRCIVSTLPEEHRGKVVERGFGIAYVAGRLLEDPCLKRLLHLPPSR
ncbi:hypothetical protein BDW22DRAFT_1205685 [Trametopsis cervina]|nr:hypothetical protein BDW22DRAFT_1205685 [Trametopsis cervina]